MTTKTVRPYLAVLSPLGEEVSIAFKVNYSVLLYIMISLYIVISKTQGKENSVILSESDILQHYGRV